MNQPWSRNRCDSDQNHYDQTENSKFVFTGDIYQIDTPYLDAESNGLSYLIDKAKGHPLYAHITLQKGERSELANLATELL